MSRQNRGIKEMRACVLSLGHTLESSPHTPGDFLPDSGSGSGPSCHLSPASRGTLARGLAQCCPPTTLQSAYTHPPESEDLWCRVPRRTNFPSPRCKSSPEGKYQNQRTSCEKLKIRTHSGTLTQGREGRPAWSPDGGRLSAPSPAGSARPTAAGHVEQTVTRPSLRFCPRSHTPSRTELAYLAC